jgi:hypothetical protein
LSPPHSPPLRSVHPHISAILDGSRGSRCSLKSWMLCESRRDANTVPHHDSDPTVADDNEDTGSNQTEAKRLAKIGAGVLFVGLKHVERAEEQGCYSSTVPRRLCTPHVARTRLRDQGSTSNGPLGWSWEKTSDPRRLDRPARGGWCT